MLTLLHFIAIAWTGTTTMSSSSPFCTYRVVGSAFSHTGMRAEEKIRTCATGVNVVTLDNQIYIIYHKNNKIQRSLVVQFESHAGKPVPIEFHGNALLVHVGKNEEMTVWQRSVAGVIVGVRRDYIERTKYRFMDVYGNSVKHCCRANARR